MASRGGLFTRRPRRTEVFIWQVLLAVVILGLWEVLSRAGALNPVLFSRPSAIISQAWQLYISKGSIWSAVGQSAEEVALGLACSIAFGIPVGLLLGRVPRLGLTTQPFLVAILATPIVALMPLSLVWFGVGLLAKVSLIFVGSVVVILINVSSGSRAVPRNWIELADAYSAPKWREFVEVVLPASVPSMIVGIRLAIASALITMFVAEYFASNLGLGYTIVNSAGSFQMSTYFVCVLTLTLIGVLASAALKRLENGPLSKFSRV